MKKFLIKNSDGKPSVTMTAFVLGFIVVNAKLLLSGVTIGTFVISTFDGVSYAAAIVALGGVYIMRKKVDLIPKSEHKIEVGDIKKTTKEF